MTKNKLPQQMKIKALVKEKKGKKVEQVEAVSKDGKLTKGSTITSVKRTPARESKFSMGAIIYFTVLAVIFVLQLYTKSFEVSKALYTVIFSGAIYLTISGKFHWLAPVFSGFALIATIAYLPTNIYLLTGKEPTFLLTSIIVAFLFTLLAGNSVSFSQFSIRSPWIANLIGLITINAVSYVLISIPNFNKPNVITIISFFAYLLASLSYLTLGRYIWVRNPKRDEENLSLLQLMNAMGDSGYLYSEVKTRSELQSKLLDNVTQDSEYRIVSLKSPLSVTTENKNFIKNYSLWEDGEKRPIYSWLLREASRSYEKKGKKGTPDEYFLIMNQGNNATNGVGDIIEIPLKRSNQKYYIGRFTLGEKITPETIERFKELMIALKVKNREK